MSQVYFVFVLYLYLLLCVQFHIGLFCPRPVGAPYWVASAAVTLRGVHWCAWWALRCRCVHALLLGLSDIVGVSPQTLGFTRSHGITSRNCHAAGRPPHGMPW